MQNLQMWAVKKKLPTDPIFLSHVTGNTDIIFLRLILGMYDTYPRHGAYLFISTMIQEIKKVFLLLLTSKTQW